MKKAILFLFLIIFAVHANAQTANPKYDKALAESLGADSRGMKMYVLAILKTGSNTTTDTAILNPLFAGHMANINRLAAMKKLIVAGPLEKNDKTYRGIFIFNVPTIKEAQELVMTDPAVKNKIFDVELFQWYGSAALPEYLKADEKIRK